MIERIIGFSIRHRGLVILAGLVLALWGVYAVYHTPVDAIPDLSESQVVVFTEWLGHSPREVEDQVTYPLSLHLQGLAGVRVVRSSSDVNFSMIHVIFEDGVDFRAARREVAERLARAGGALPPGVTPSLAPDAAATGQIFWYTVEGPGSDLGKLRSIQDWYVRPQLNSVPGVAEVASVGGYPVEYQIEVDPLRLRAYGATLADVVRAVDRTNAAVGGHVVQKANAEYLVRGVGWIGTAPDATNQEFDPVRAVRDLENVVLPTAAGTLLRVGDVARVALGGQPRRGVLEKDGTEAVGGVVLMRAGENPLEVTRRIKQKLQDLQAGLPAGVRVVPFYDRTPLIEGAVRTVTGTVVEAIIAAAVCVLLVLVHFRTSLIIAITLPLAALASFAIMWTLRVLGLADIQTNIMSLAGIAISVGVLVDSSVVMAENVMYTLKQHFGDRPVGGDVRHLVLPACRLVGRPIFFSVVIMLLSFFPVFALGGIEGKMFHPLAFTKSFALAAVAVLSITLVPALCTIFIKGRLRGEQESWLVRSVLQVYRPVLDYLLDRPAPLLWVLGVTFLVGLAPLGNRWLFLGALFLSLMAGVLVKGGWLVRAAFLGSLVLVALLADQWIEPLGHEFITPLDEGMVMDMPITVPRASVTQAGDDLKARDMIFCRFPEVDMVVGKAGRAETATDPAPLDMIETMINFREREFWPKRKLRKADAERQARDVLVALTKQGVIEPPGGPAAEAALAAEAATAVLPLYDALMREFAYQKNQEFERAFAHQLIKLSVDRLAALLRDNGTLRRDLSPGDITLLCKGIPLDLGQRLAASPALEDTTRLAHETARRLKELGFVDADVDLLQDHPNPLMRGLLTVHGALGGTPPTFLTRLHDAVVAGHRAGWREHVHALNGELFDRGVNTYTRLVLEQLLTRATVTDPAVGVAVQERRRLRSQPAPAVARRSGHHHHGGAPGTPLPTLDPQPVLNQLQKEASQRFARRVWLWRKDRADLAGFGGELDRVMQMPGWTNVWTMPIQNRVDMLSTGVNTAVGIRVLGRNLEDVVRASEAIVPVVKRIRGAADVIADPVRGKGYLEIHIDHAKAARHGVNAGDINDLVETALGGKVVTQTVEGRERHPVRVRYARAWRDSEEAVRELLVPVSRNTDDTGQTRKTGRRQVPLAEVADIRIVEGPATIKSEDGLLRNYVRLNVRGRDTVEFVEEARRAVASQVPLPAGVYLEWTGQFEHEVRARKTLTLILPLVVGLIVLILYLTYQDWADAVLMLLAVPGAVAGGIFFQWLFGYKFSVTVWVGYIACFGMATATGIIMLVYLRDAVARAGGLSAISLDQLRQAVMDGAVHRLRPKLLTEGTIVLGLAPMLWATGTGAEVIRPMAAPVLGGILIADEVVDLLLPVLFYRVRRWRWRRCQGEQGLGKGPAAEEKKKGAAPQPFESRKADVP
jgi:Cu(I)/Ag(I) efflux system membrane protein CusA/SilA